MSKFKVGDEVMCVESGLRDELVEGQSYKVRLVNDSLGGCYVALDGLPAGYYYFESRFVLAKPAQPQTDEQPEAGDKALEYLMDEMTGYATQPAEDEYDIGYHDAIRDMLEAVYGVKAAISVEFVQIDGDG